MLEHRSFSHGGETPEAGKMRIPNQKRKERKKERGRKKQSSRTGKRTQYVHADDSCATPCVPRPNVLVQSRPTSPLSLSLFRLALYTRSAKAHTKLPRPSSHPSAAPHTLESRSQFYVPKSPTNWRELSALLAPRTIPELQVPIRCPENSNQLGRSACHFDTPESTRTPGPNSRSRTFQPTGESCPPF